MQEKKYEREYFLILKNMVLCILPALKPWMSGEPVGSLQAYCLLTICPAAAQLPAACRITHGLAQPQQTVLLPLHLAARLPQLPSAAGLSEALLGGTWCACSESTLQICMLIFSDPFDRRSRERLSVDNLQNPVSLVTCLL